MTDNILQQEDCIATEHHWSADYFMVLGKRDKGGPGPQAAMLESMALTNDKLAMCYEPTSTNRWLAHYSSAKRCLQGYNAISGKDRKFYEILCGPVHTCADLDWKGREELQEGHVVAAFEQVFQEAARQYLPDGLPDPEFI